MFYKDLYGVIRAKRDKYLRDNLPNNASFWQVSLSNVLSKYPNKFHYFKNLIFMTSSL